MPRERNWNYASQYQREQSEDVLCNLGMIIKEAEIAEVRDRNGVSVAQELRRIKELARKLQVDTTGGAQVGKKIESQFG